MPDTDAYTEPSAGSVMPLYKKLLAKFEHSGDLLEAHPHLLIINGPTSETTFQFCFGDVEVVMTCHVQTENENYYIEMATFYEGYRTAMRRIRRLLADADLAVRAADQVSRSLRSIEPSARPALLDMVRRTSTEWI